MRVRRICQKSARVAQGKYPSGIPKANTPEPLSPLPMPLLPLQPVCPGGVVAMRNAEVIDLGRERDTGLGDWQTERNCQMLACGQHLSVINARGPCTGSRIRCSQRRTSASRYERQITTALNLIRECSQRLDCSYHYNIKARI